MEIRSCNTETQLNVILALTVCGFVDRYHTVIQLQNMCVPTGNVRRKSTSCANGNLSDSIQVEQRGTACLCDYWFSVRDHVQLS